MLKCWGRWGFGCTILHMNWPRSVWQLCSAIRVRSSLLWSKVWHVLILSPTSANPPLMPTMNSWDPTLFLVINPLHACRDFSNFRTVANIGKLKARTALVIVPWVWCLVYYFYNLCHTATRIVVWLGFLLCTWSWFRWIFIITKTCPSPSNYPILLLITVINISKHESFSMTLSSCGQVAIVSCMVHPTMWSSHDHISMDLNASVPQVSSNFGGCNAQPA